MRINGDDWQKGDLWEITQKNCGKWRKSWVAISVKCTLPVLNMHYYDSQQIDSVDSEAA